LTELKAFPKPPPAVVTVTAAVMVLLANKTKKIPKDRSWNAAKVMMGKVSLYSHYSVSCDGGQGEFLLYECDDESKVSLYSMSCDVEPREFVLCEF